MKHVPMMVAIFVLALMTTYCAIRVSNAVTPAEELQIASAYHCGMLDALQEKRGRGRACDEYKTIARKRGVSVPP
jgi:hypothetical protein